MVTIKLIGKRVTLFHAPVRQLKRGWRLWCA